ncbi:xanthine dehydrogenase family protein subunit M [Streptomyces sp. DSM 44917]|uniref:Xanthine dehydrogenase family protein subunit M n=1 Tax=Streptomyces boetiae TaxID=3075541 RepID=A0ABU2LCH8_9ACTN|nr:xanthine dehydrogenase family protein subunit M [Streptomyces sp. DSM 44917]MDT0309287.1 xanthine dehydrogenase family protein subunit M [Streptomyces sp. DSM 44917]
MRPFAYERAADAATAVALVAERPGAAFLGGGTNLVDHMRLGLARPELLVDVSRLPHDTIAARPDGGVRIGAAVRNSDLAADPLIRERYPLLAGAVLAGASGQLRNLATTGGNLLQRTRCPYFQDLTTPCNKRSPGTGCSALEGFHRGHAILGASERCVAVHPSDMAVALTAPDATVRVLGPDGERAIPVGEFQRLPGERPDPDTVLAHGELITAVDLPPLPPAMAARSGYRKVRERASFAFALVSVAAALEVRDGVARRARVALGGVAHRPWRRALAEEALAGAPAFAQRPAGGGPLRIAATNGPGQAAPFRRGARRGRAAPRSVAAARRVPDGVAPRGRRSGRGAPGRRAVRCGCPAGRAHAPVAGWGAAGAGGRGAVAVSLRSGPPRGCRGPS